MYTINLPADQSGIVSEIIANEIGVVALMLGAGRQTQDSVIDLAVGIVLHKKIGDTVKQGEPLLTIHSNRSSIDDVKEKLFKSITITNKHVSVPPLLHDMITI